MKKRRKHRPERSDRQLTEAERRFEAAQQYLEGVREANKVLQLEHQKEERLSLLERLDTSRQTEDDADWGWSFTVGRIQITDGPVKDAPVQVISPTLGAWGIPEMHSKVLNYVDGREPMKKVRQYLETKEIAELLEVSYDTARRRLIDGDIPSYESAAGRRRARVADVIAYITRLGYPPERVQQVRVQIKALLLGETAAEAA